MSYPKFVNSKIHTKQNCYNLVYSVQQLVWTVWLTKDSNFKDFVHFRKILLPNLLSLNSAIHLQSVITRKYNFTSLQVCVF